MEFLSMGLIVTMAGLFVAGLAAVLGIWMERDQTRPPRFAYALSILILIATFVGLAQAYLDAQSSMKLEEDIARMLEMLDELAQNSDDPALADFVASEMNAQSRANPKILKRVEKRAKAAGRDPSAIMNRNVQGAGRGKSAGGAGAGAGGKASGGKSATPTSAGAAGKAAGEKSTDGAAKTGKSGGDAGKAEGDAAGKSAEGKTEGGTEGDAAGKSTDDKSAGGANKAADDGKSGGKAGGKSGGKAGN